MSVDIELEGIDNVIAKLTALGRKGNQAINKALEDGAKPILDEIKNTKLFDDRSGRLRKAQKISKVKTRRNVKYIWVGDVDKEAPWGWNVEFGSSKQPARPYMRDAWARKKQEAQVKIKETLREELSRIE